MKCIYHLCSNELSGRQTMYCSRKCNNKAHVAQWRQRVKLKSIEYKGGKCQNCGYSRCVSALEFHHRDPHKKDFSITAGTCKAWHKIKIELNKCDILCANCHREKHTELGWGG
jgi:hypothetical protein